MRLLPVAILTILALIMGAGMVGSLEAMPTDGVSSGAKIGYVDFNRALNEVSDGVAAKKRLKDEFREKQERLNHIQSELAKMKESLDRDRLILSSADLEAREKAYRQKYVEVQQRYAEFTSRMAEREAHLTKDILGRLRQIVREIGDREGFSLILEKSQEIVLYSPSTADLTSRLIQEYNRSQTGKK